MTKAEFIHIAKSYNLSLGQSIMGPIAIYNNKIVMVLWEDSVIIFKPERFSTSNRSTLVKYLPHTIKYFKEKQFQEKLNQIKEDFV